jgi:hypothetical protein
MEPSIDRLDVGGDSATWLAGARAKGEFRCASCGYGVTVYRVLPECPMCRGSNWERVPWRPFSRSYRASQNVG